MTVVTVYSGETDVWNAVLLFLPLLVFVICVFCTKTVCRYGNKSSRNGGKKVVKPIKGGLDYWKNEQNAHIPYAEGSERLRKNLLPDSYLDSWICQSLSHCEMRFFTRDVSERMRINSLAAELLYEPFSACTQPSILHPLLLSGIDTRLS